MTLTMSHPVSAVLGGRISPDNTPTPTPTGTSTSTRPMSPAGRLGSSTSSAGALAATGTSPSNEARTGVWEALPPEYETVRPSPPSPPPSLHDGEDPVNRQTTQLVRQQEKQALKEAWAEQNLSPIAPTEEPIPTFEAPQDRQPSPLSTGDRRVSSTVSAKESSRESVLPQGMDIREALEKCDDPALGWSLQFWVTIADPITQQVFFACPANGHCSWEPPIGAFVVPRSPDGEWWELTDTTRGNRSYYYNTLTGKTQWTRPGDGAFVIPLGLIQRNVLPSRPGTASRGTSSSTSLHSAQQAASSSTALLASVSTSHLPGPPSTPGSLPRVASSSRVNMERQSFGGSDHTPSLTSTPIRMYSDPIPLLSSEPPTSAVMTPSPTSSIIRQNSPFAPHRARLSVVDEASGNETDPSDRSAPQNGWWGKNKYRVSSIVPSSKKGKQLAGLHNPPRPPPLSIDTGANVNRHSALADHVHAESQTPSRLSPHVILPQTEPTSPIFVDNVRTKRLSSGLHPLLPSAISSDIQNFQQEDFASKYFATRRSGVLRVRVPLDRIMEWQRQPITSPLLVISKSLVKDALTTFRVIQHVMGDRDRPVENARPTVPASSSLRRDRRSGSEGWATEKVTILEEIRWMIQLGVMTGEMRDEIYSQLIKQLIRNPEHESVVLGFQLFCILVNAFTPSKNFEVFVKSFLAKEGGLGTDGITVMARYCRNKLQSMVDKGERGRILSLGEIEHASDAAFYPSVYGQKLEYTMQLQSRSYPSLKVPVILPFLADSILSLGGLKSEGIFRVPGDNDSVSELKSRIDRGQYQLDRIDDPHVAASLFKLWLRELEEPLVPDSLYNAALKASKSTDECLGLVSRLPKIHRRVLLFVISFVQLFLAEQVVEQTKMTPQNLSLVLAPNILRTTSQDLETVYMNSSFESRFVLQLLLHLRPGEVDPDYIPVHGGGMQ